ncbi:MAG: enoyl-CoA hydratase/isomerase family protein [Pseudomonadota bacterium]
MSEQTLVTREGPALIVAFNRPEALNALTDAMLAQTRAAMVEALTDPTIAAVVLTGSARAFCAGGDLKGTAESTLPPYDKYLKRFTETEWHAFARFLHRFPRPVIAAVEGHCYGGGLELALIADFIVASETAKFGLTEASHGLFPILGGAWSLARAVGPRQAKALAFTAKRFGAEEALRLQIAVEVTPAGDAVPRAVAMAGEIANCAPLAVAAAKQAIDRAHGQSFDEGLTAAGEFSLMLMFSEDRAEGLAAFKEKRAPKFKGR